MKTKGTFKTITFASAIALSGVLFTQCKGDKLDVSGGNTPETTTEVGKTTAEIQATFGIKPVNIFKKENEVPVEKFMINASTESNLTTVGGTNISIPANSLVDGNGVVVVGEVEFKVQQLDDKSELMLSGKPTVSPDGLLESAGSYNFSASQNGNDLDLKNGSKAKIAIPIGNHDTEDDMEVFYGETQNITNPDGSVTEQFVWVVDETESNVVVTSTGVGISEPSYLMTITQLTWVNCDRFIGLGVPKIYVTVDVGDDYENGDPGVAVFFKEINSIMEAQQSPNSSVFTSGRFPSGSNVTLVIIANKEEVLYHQLIDTIPNENIVIENLDLQPITEADLVSKLNALDD